MEETQATAVLILMFALRCIAPLLITLAIGYLMNRLVDRWQAEDAAREVDVDDFPAPQPIPAPGLRLPTVTGLRIRMRSIPLTMIRGMFTSIASQNMLGNSAGRYRPGAMMLPRGDSRQRSSSQ